MKTLITVGISISLLMAIGCGSKNDGPSNAPHRLVTNGKNPYTIQWFDQTLNHSDATDTRTFKQRYIIDTQYAKGKSAPVIYYVCGEGNCMKGELDPDRAWVVGLAKKMGAYLVALEHRYYGESQPFDQMTAANMKYLTMDQALQDLATFEEWIISTQGLTGKWLTIGGSYPAQLAALYRMEHPELAAGAIASSACPKLDQDSVLSDKIAAQTAGAQCTAKYRSEILNPILKAVGSSQINDYKKLFDATDIVDDTDFVGALTGMSVVMVQYGAKKMFCDAVNSATPMADYAKAMAKLLKAWDNTRLINWSYTGNMDPKATLYESGFGFRQWIYQACTEQSIYSAGVMKANPDESESLSSKITDPLPAKYCSVYYGIQPPTNLDQMNAKYYEPLLDPAKTSNILFVSGSADPACFAFAIAHENGNDTNPNTATYTVKDGSHCQDLSAPEDTDSASLQGARDLELKLATKWVQ